MDGRGKVIIMSGWSPDTARYVAGNERTQRGKACAYYGYRWFDGRPDAGRKDIVCETMLSDRKTS